jgi:adenylate kinase family enzyme
VRGSNSLLHPPLSPAVVALTGRAASGKSTISRELSRRTGWVRVSYGEWVRAEAVRRGLDESRESLQILGAELVEADLEGFLRTVMISYGWQPGNPAILDSIRYRRALGVLQRLVRPLPLVTVFVDLGNEERIRRMNASGEVADKDYLATVDGRRTETDWVDLRMRAHICVDGRNRPDDSAERILRLITHAFPQD